MTTEYNKQIASISDNVRKLISQKSQSSAKLEQLEEKMSKLQQYITQPTTIINNGETSYQNTELKSAFDNYIRKGQLSDLITKSMHGEDDASGGVLLVPELQHKIEALIRHKSPIRALAQVNKIGSSSLEILLEEGEFNSGWVGETEARIETESARLKKMSIAVHEHFAQPKVSQRLLDDSFLDVESWLAEKISDAFAREENLAFLSGNGDRKPFGLLTRAAENEDIEKINASEADLNADLFLEMMHKIPEQYLASSTFLMHRSTLSKIRGLRDQAGRFIWSQTFNENLTSSIFGVPVVCTSEMPQFEDGKMPIILADFKKAYRILDRQDMAIMRDPYTEKPFVKFYATKRLGGDVVAPQAMNVALIDGDALNMDDQE